MIRLLFAGDLIPPDTSANIFSEKLMGVLQDKDFSIVNLETPLTLGKNKIEKTGNNFKRSPSAIRHVTEGYFDAVALSNNHIRDYGDEGVNDTLNTCAQNGILTVGAGRNAEEAAKPLRLNLKGNKFCILNYSEREFNTATETRAGANSFDLIDVFYQIKSEKEKNDYVIVIFHGGLESHYYPTIEMVKIFKLMIDIGSDFIVAHHTHRYSGVITHAEKPILFGLGNFLTPTKRNVTNEWLTGLIAKISFNKKSIGLELIPVNMSNNFNKVDLMKSNNSTEVLKHVIEISAIIKNENLLVKYWLVNDKIESSNIIRLLKSRSKLEYRLRKYLYPLFINKISIYRRKNLLNILKCDSHRNKVIRILEYS